jgi:hypothetical protein
LLFFFFSVFSVGGTVTTGADGNNTRNYVFSFSNPSGRDNYARADIQYVPPVQPTALSFAFWFKSTNSETMRTNARLLTDQVQILANTSNGLRASSSFFTTILFNANTRNGFGSMPDLRVVMRLFNASSSASINADVRSVDRSIFVNRWHHCAVTYDQGLLSLFLDTVQVGQTRYAGATYVIMPNSTRFAIGAVPPATTFPPGVNATAYADAFDDTGLTGSMDDVRMYDTALTPDQLRRVYFGLEPDFSGSLPATQPVIPLPDWIKDLSAQDPAMHGTKFREYSPGNDNVTRASWYVTQRASTALAWQRGWPANASDMEPITLPWKPEDLQIQNLSTIREYYLCYGQRWAPLPAKNQSLVRARQWAVGFGQSVPTLPNFNGTTSNVPEARCRGNNLGLTVVNAFPRFKSWAQYESTSCRANDDTAFFRMAIRVTALPNTTLDVKFFEWIDDAYRAILPDYAVSAVPIADASLELTLPPTVPTDSNGATITTTSTTTEATTTIRNLGTTFNASEPDALKATEFVGINLALLIAGVLLACTLLTMVALKIRRRLQRRIVHKSNNRHSLQMTRSEAAELDRSITQKAMLTRLDTAINGRELRSARSFANFASSADPTSGSFDPTMPGAGGSMGHGHSLHHSQSLGGSFQSAGNTMLARPARAALELDDDEAVDPPFV